MAGWFRIAAVGACFCLGLGMAPARADLVINEILASNHAYPVEGGTPDLVEIHNTGPDDVRLGDVSGRMALTNDPYGDPRRFWHFPIGTILRPGECLSVACDASGKFGMHANFQVTAGGDVVALIGADGRTIIDMVRFHRQYANISYARIPDGSDTWKYTSRPTFFFGTLFGGGDPVCFDEELLRPGDHAVFCEPPSATCPDSCVNVLEEAFIPDISDDDYRPALPKATDDVVVIARVSPGEDQVVVKLVYWTESPDQVEWADMHDDGEGPDAVIDRQGRNVGAGDGWWTGVIPAQPAGTTVRFRLTSRLIARGEPKPPDDPVPDPCQDWEPALDHAPNLYTVENADPHGLRVNEALALNQTIIQDYSRQYDDWVEIYNPSDADVDLAEYHLTQNPSQPFPPGAWTFPKDRPELTVIPAKGYILVWMDGDTTIPGLSELHAGFRLNGLNGDRIYLANEKGVFDGIDFLDDPRHPGPCDLTDDEQNTDISIGRVPDGADGIARILEPTPGAPNPAGPAPIIEALGTAPEGGSCAIPCGSPSFAAFGRNLVPPSLVQIDDGSMTKDALQDIDDVQVVGDALVIADDRCGRGARKTLWVHTGEGDARVAAKVRFHCVPEIVGVEPADPQGDEEVTFAVCGFDRIATVTLDGEPWAFTVSPARAVPPEAISLWLPSCSEGGEGRVEIVDVDGYAQAISLCGACTERAIVSIDPDPVPPGATLTVQLACMGPVTGVKIDGEDVSFTEVRPGVVEIAAPPCAGGGERTLEVRDADGPVSASFTCAGVEFIRGDASADGRMDLGDAIRILNYLFGAGGLDCVKTADVDDDGVVVIGDPIYVLNYMFGGEPAPAEPFSACGPDPTDDGLPCEGFGACP